MITPRQISRDRAFEGYHLSIFEVDGAVELMDCTVAVANDDCGITARFLIDSHGAKDGGERSGRQVMPLAKTIPIAVNDAVLVSTHIRSPRNELCSESRSSFYAADLASNPEGTESFLFQEGIGDFTATLLYVGQEEATLLHRQNCEKDSRAS